jgi:hypothetical protein
MGGRSLDMKRSYPAIWAKISHNCPAAAGPRGQAQPSIASPYPLALVHVPQEGGSPPESFFSSTEVSERMTEVGVNWVKPPGYNFISSSD